MCGRYALTSNPELLARLFGLTGVFRWKRRYNIAPTQPAPVVRAGSDNADERRVDALHWGLIPSWAKDPAIGNRMINARSEAAAEKPAFRAAMRKRRCLVPADAFYEWQKTKDGKQPYCIRMTDEAPFAMAGLWEWWRDRNAGEDEEAIESFTILTTTPNALMRELHDRMPVIIEPEHYARWLDPDVQDPEKLADLLKPPAADLMTAHPVSRRVNSPRNDDAQCIAPVEEPQKHNTGEEEGLFA